MENTPNTPNTPPEPEKQPEATPAPEATPPPAAEAPPPAPEAAAVTGEVSKEAKTFGMLCHLCALAGFIIPFGNIIGPLIIWLIKKDTEPFVDDQGKEALNFQITIAIAMFVCILLSFIVIGIPLAIALGIASLIFIIIAAIQDNAAFQCHFVGLELRL